MLETDPINWPNNAARYSIEDHYYSLYGDTSYLEKATHFFNTVPTQDLTIRKNLVAEDGASITEADLQQNFSFTAKFSFPDGGPEAGETWIFPVTRYDASGSAYDAEKVPLTGDTVHMDAAGIYTVGGSDLPADVAITGYMKVTGGDTETETGENGEDITVYPAQFSATATSGADLDWNDTFQLKGKEWLSIHGLPTEAGYTVVLQEVGVPPLITVQPKDGRGVLTIDPEKSDNETQFTFTNTKHPEPVLVNLDVLKTFTDQSAPPLGEGESVAETFNF